MNIQMLQQIKAEILAKPASLRMDVWTCGSAHCIAGHACVLAGVEMPRRGGRLRDGRTVLEAATKVLGLSIASRHRLFDVAEWPDSFQFAYRDALGDHAEQARIAADRIDRFMATED